MSRLQILLLSVFFILTIFASRIASIDSFPIFIDETVHIHTAERLSEVSPLLNIGLGRVGTIWWLWLFQPTQSNPIWVARVATAIAVMVGHAALIKIASQSVGRMGVILMGLFLLFSPYHYFFERLALADPLAASPILVAIALGLRLRIRLDYLDAVLCGGFLALGIFAKTNVLPYAGVVLAAIIAHHHRYQLKSLGRWFVAAVVGLLLPIVAFETLVRLTDNRWLTATFSYVANRTDVEILLIDRMVGNIGDTLTFVSHYLHPVLFVILLSGVIWAFCRRRWYLLLVFLAPLLPLWIGEPQETRYWLVPVGLLGLIGVLSVSDIVHNRSRVTQLFPIVLLLVWGGLKWVPQAFVTAYNPVAINLPDVDKRQYIYSDATGFGFEQITNYISADTQTSLIGLLANCQGLRYSYWNTYDVLCRTVNPNGSDIPMLISWVEESRGNIQYVILEDNVFLPQIIDGDVIALIARPMNLANLKIYEIESEIP